MKNLVFKSSFFIASLLILGIYSCTKDNPVSKDLVETNVQEIAERSPCQLLLNPVSSTASNWQAKLYGKINGSWTLLNYIGGPSSPATIKLAPGVVLPIALDGYTELRIDQIQMNTFYTLSAPSGSINVTVISASTFRFFAGCDPLPECSMGIRIGNACENTWKCNIFRRDQNNVDVLYKVIGGMGSDAEIKIPTGFTTANIPISGFSQYTFVQQSGSTNYILTTPNAGQTSFTFDMINGNNPCMGNLSYPGNIGKFIGCVQ